MTRTILKIKKYRTAFKKQLVSFIAEYGTDVNVLATAFQIPPETLLKWFFLYPDFKETYLACAEEFDVFQIEQKLKQLSLGITKTRKKYGWVKKYQGLDGNGKPIFVPEWDMVELTEESPQSELNAIDFYLTNRAPERWKKTKAIEVTGDLGELVQTHIYLPDNKREKQLEQVA